MQLATANQTTKTGRQPARQFSADDNGRCQLIVNIIPAVLNGYRTAAPPAGDHRNRLATITAKREQEAVQLLVIGIDIGNDIFFSQLCRS